ncbi:hypothetical protein [Pseudomonas fluorescens]|uniref:Transmembrane protein n=1 Tax=Pseudomonas fluorescens TaxID=294 RepID=A0A5E7FP36_PSEFL|nr:hypothetical protein [Pseudomonas fluorescens]VVO41271.1 hypothetical protein PS833_05854 [Pseudomonas fluorescens]
MSWLAFWILAGPILLAIASTAYSLYLRWRYLDAMLEALKNSRYVHTWGPGLRQQGWFGGLLLIAKIAGMVTMPRVSIRIGELDPEDNKNFPPHLKRLLKIKAVMLAGIAVWGFIAYGLMKLE